MKGVYIPLEIEEIEEALQTFRHLIRMMIDEFKSFPDNHSIVVDKRNDIGNGSYRHNR
mgnify:CR=1 FL=1